MYNILFIHTGDNWIRGSERVLLNIINSLDKSKFNPFFICDKPIMKQEAEKYNIKTKLIKLNNFLLYSKPKYNIFAFLSTISKIKNFCKKNKIDLIYTSSGYPAQYSYFASKSLKIPLLTHIQCVYSNKEIKRALINKSTKIISDSNFIRKKYPNSITIYNGINPENFQSKINLRNEFNFKKSDIIIGTIGSLIIRKGIKYLILAAKEILKEYNNIKFLIIGDGPLKNQLQTLANNPNIIFTGNRKDIPQLLATMDIFILPSLSEAFGQVLIEAISASLPIIASNTGGIPEVVPDKNFLFQPKDYQELSKKIIYLIKDKNKRLKIGKKGLEKVNKIFSDKIINKQIEDLLLAYLK